MQTASNVQMIAGSSTAAGVRTSTLVAAGLAIIAVAALASGVLAYQSERRAQRALALAEQGRARAETHSVHIDRQRAAALLARTRLLADLANRSIDDGDCGT